MSRFSDFTKQMDQVFILLPGISPDARAGMTERVRDFAVKFGVPPMDVAFALNKSLARGVPEEDVFAFLEQAHVWSVLINSDLISVVVGPSFVIDPVMAAAARNVGLQGELLRLNAARAVFAIDLSEWLDGVRSRLRRKGECP